MAIESNDKSAPSSRGNNFLKSYYNFSVKRGVVDKHARWFVHWIKYHLQLYHLYSCTE